jgi:hypothetical protein
LQKENSLPYQLTLLFNDDSVEVTYAMNPQQLMCTVFHLFENFRDDMMPVHSEYNQSGQLCFWEIHYGGDFPKELYPLVDAEVLLRRATIRNIAWKPVVTFPIAKNITIPNRRYVWACIEDGVVTDWRDFQPTTDKDTIQETRRNMVSELGQNNSRVKSGLVKGRTLHIVRPPSHLIKTAKADA